MAKQYNIKAIIYDKRDRILSIAQNSYYKTHPLQARIAKSCKLDHKIYLHAEVAAIIKCNDISKAHRIFVSRFDSLGNPKCAKPCPICIRALYNVGIKVIEHT